VDDIKLADLEGVDPAPDAIGAAYLIDGVGAQVGQLHLGQRQVPRLIVTAIVIGSADMQSRRGLVPSHRSRGPGRRHVDDSYLTPVG
jgi:hypothetical protein